MRKTGIVRAFLIALLSCGLVFALAACSTNYTVSYSLGEHAADDATVPESAEYAQGTQITLPAAPAAEEGWQFTAWSDGEQTYGAGASYVVEDNVTFTATWDEVSPEPVSYTVTYALGGHAADGAEVPAAQTVEAGTGITLPAAPEAAENWAFDGWNDGEQTYAAGTSYTVESNVTFTAVWKDVTPAPETYTVTFDANGATGGSVPEAMTGNLSGAQIDLPANAGDLTKEGYTFGGWSETSGGAAIGGKYTVTGDVTLYAVWTAKQFTVVLDYNYDGAEDGTVSVTFGSTFGAASGWVETPVCTGYEFLGWYENVDGTGTRYTGSTQITTELAQGFTLYAKWAQTTYTVTFDANGGTVGGAGTKEIRVEENGTVSADAVETPERTGYRFGGWYHDDTALVFGETKITADITFMARWTQVWTVTVGGEPVATLAEGETYTLEVPEAVGGQTFMGWTSGGTLAYTAENRIVTMGTSDIVLAEKWAIHDSIATEEEFLAVLADEAATAITLKDSFGVHQAVSVARTLTINLNGETLTFVTAENAGPSEVASLNIAEEGGNVTINGGEDGAIVFDVAYTGVTYRDAFSGGTAPMNGTFSPLSVWGTLTLNNVDVTSTTSAIAVARGTLNMTGGSITADGTYGIGTNATVSEGQPLYGDVTISLENVTIAAKKGYFNSTWTNDSAAVLINVPGTLTMKNVTATGARQGVVVRGGTAMIENSTVVSLGTCTDKSYLEEDWGSGSNLPHAALVVGDRSGGYAYPAEVTLGTGNTFTGNNEALEIYAYADENTSATIRGAGYCDLITVGNGSETVAFEHSYGELIAQKDPTCTQPGVKAHYECSVCGKLFTKEGDVYTEVSEEELAISALEHEYGELSYNSETGKVEKTCVRGDDTQFYGVVSITIDQKPDSIIVGSADIGEAVSLDGFVVVARGAWGSEDIAIPADALTAVVTGNAYQNAVITVATKVGEISATAEGITLYTQIISGGNVDVYQAPDGLYNPTAQSVGTFEGEFEIRFTLSNLERGRQSVNNLFESWLLQFSSGGQIAVVREDNFVLNNFGRNNAPGNTGANFIGTTNQTSAVLTGFTDETGDFYKELQEYDTLDFVIARSYADGAYTLTITITGGTKVAVLTIVEPDTATNEMTVWFGAEDASYDYSVVYGTERGLTVQTLTASQESISVANGTSLNAALSQIVFHATYAESSIPGVVTDYTVVADGGYDAAVASTYTVTVARDGVEETVSITVQTSVEVTSVTLLKEYGLNEDGDMFIATYGTAFGTKDGTFAQGGFKANAVNSVSDSDNPLAGKTLNGGFTIHLELYVNAPTAWSRIFSINRSGSNGFLSVLYSGTGVRVSYNDYASPEANYVDMDTTQLPTGSVRITISVADDGSLSIYINNVLASHSGGSGGIGLSNCVETLTTDSTFDEVSFFGGADFWVDSVFDGYIQSCAIYNGVVSAEDVPNL